SSSRTSPGSPCAWPTWTPPARRWRRRARNASAQATRASARWPSSSTRTATRSSCTGGTTRERRRAGSGHERRLDGAHQRAEGPALPAPGAGMSRAEALERYNELPVPGTTEEHWRFTDLRGFDPDAFEQGRGQTPDVAVPSMLALDVAAEAAVTETGIEITRAPAEI